MAAAPMFGVLCSLLAAQAQALSTGGTTGTSWMQQEELQELNANRQPHQVLHGIVDLDLPPEQRWTKLLANHTEEFQFMVKYLKSHLPEWIQSTFLSAMRKAIKYRGFPDDYRREMQGIADTLNMDVGIVVMGNLLYELEHLGTKCSYEHATGPCRGHHTYDEGTDMSFPFCLPRADARPGPEGMCTSTVAESNSGSIIHGRNLDWYFPMELRRLMIDVEFQRGGKTLFIGSGMLGSVGILTGMKPGVFSWSLNARKHGGWVLANFLEAVSRGSLPTAMHARRAFESAGSYDEAVAALAAGRILNPSYYIMAGTEKGQGLVMTRDRAGPADLWRLNKTQVNGWYRLQTNTDHWIMPNPNDDRMFPGYALMQYVGRADMAEDTMSRVMRTWPIFNYHTIFTAIIDPKRGTYVTMWWDDGANHTGVTVVV